MEIGERLRYIIKLHQLTASSFAEKIGVQPSSISHILSGRNKPSIDFIQKVLEHFPKVDAAWLISGKQKTEANSLLSTNSNDSKQSEKHKITANKSSDKVLLKVLLLYSDGTTEEYIHKAN